MITERIIKDLEEEILPEFDSEIKKLANKTILITGGNGFLPSYLVDTIVMSNKRHNLGIKLIIVNKNEVTHKSRLGHLLTNKDITFVKADVGKKFDIPHKPNIIIHAASRANPSSFLADPIDTINANVLGAWYLLDYARDNKVEKFIFFSSAEIYGNPVKEFLPTPETYAGNADSLNTWSCYIESKRFVESLAMAYFRQYKIEVLLLRILLAYGPGIRDDGKVISDFFNAAKQNRKISVRDRGDALRSFCYVSDAARAIFRAWFFGKAGETYNIGDDTNNNSIETIAKMIAKEVGEDVLVETNKDAPLKEIYGVNNRSVDTTKIRSTGYKPKVSFEEGLKRLSEHYKQVEKNEFKN